MGWTGFFKGFSAVVVAIALLLGGSFILFQFLVSQFTASPPRPTFPNDKPATAAKAPTPTKPSPTPAPVVASPKPSPSPSPSPVSKRARVTLGEGLNVRQAPSADAERVDGVDYSDEVTILEESPDKEWIKVRVDSTGVEGWIKAGYTEPVTAGAAQ